MEMINQKKVILLCIFLVVFIGHYCFSLYTPGDTMWSIPVAVSIIDEGNTNIDEFKGLIKKHSNYGITLSKGHYYNEFPLGVSLLALPFVYFAQLFSGTSLTEEIISNQYGVTGPLEILIASVIIAVNAVFIFLLGRKFLDDKYSIFLTFIFAFCTSSWTVGSRALWQHGPTMLMLTIGLYLIVAASSKPKLIQYVSIPLAFSYIIRPTNSISILFVTLFVLIEYRKYFIQYIIWAAFIAIPFLLYNFHIYDQILAPYYMPNRIGANPQFMEALAGNLISPGRGIIIFTPVVLLSIAGIYSIIKNKQFDKIDFIILMIIFTHWLAISSFGFWWGGWSIGPRFFSDMIPYFLYFMIPILQQMVLSQNSQKRAMKIIVWSLVLISFSIQLNCVSNKAAWLWNSSTKSTVEDVNESSRRVWDWTNLQFLR